MAMAAKLFYADSEIQQRIINQSEVEDLIDSNSFGSEQENGFVVNLDSFELTLRRK